MATDTKIIEDGEVLTYVVYDDGDEAYYDENDKLHRPNNKPAYIRPDGYTSYWVHGEWNRTDGPAIIRTNGREYFYLDGVEYTKENYWKEIERRNSMNIEPKNDTMMKFIESIGDITNTINVSVKYSKLDGIMFYIDGFYKDGYCIVSYDENQDSIILSCNRANMALTVTSDDIMKSLIGFNVEVFKYWESVKPGQFPIDENWKKFMIEYGFMTEHKTYTLA